MEIKSSLVLRGPDWDNVHRNMEDVFFDTLYDVFKLSVAIGILYDEQLPDEGAPEEKAELPVNIFNRNREVMSFFFKSAILTSSCVSFSEKERLYLAFSEDVTAEDMEGEDEEELKKGISKEVLDFDRAGFLKGFANYGIKKINECYSNSDSETMEQLADFLRDSYKGVTDELIEKRKVTDLEDEIDDIDELD